jgi:F-type H+-transporting ATPase subunit c
MEAMSRQPEVAGELRTTMLISIAFIEALALYTLVVALLLVMTK